MRFSEKTEYKNFYKVRNNTSVNNQKKFKGKVGKTVKHFDNIKDAARWVDIFLISINKEPVNFFTRY